MGPEYSGADTVVRLGLGADNSDTEMAVTDTYTQAETYIVSLTIPEINSVEATDFINVSISDAARLVDDVSTTGTLVEGPLMGFTAVDAVDQRDMTSDIRASCVYAKRSCQVLLFACS